jgi:hypothetical protein
VSVLEVEREIDTARILVIVNLVLRSARVGPFAEPPHIIELLTTPKIRH